MKFEIMAKVERKGEEFIIPRFWVEADNAVLARSYARQIVGDSIAISAIEVSALNKIDNPELQKALRSDSLL